MVVSRCGDGKLEEGAAMSNVIVERYDPNEDRGIQTMPMTCGSFDVDAGTLVVYSGKDGDAPVGVFAPGEWRAMLWQ